MHIAALSLFLAALQERDEIPGRLESWYKVRKGDRHVGYLHELLERGSGDLRHAYALEGEIQGAEGPAVLALEARLDDTYSPRRLEVRQAGRPRTVALPADREAYALPSLMLLALRQNGTLARPGPRREKLLDLREERPVEVSLLVEAAPPRDYAGKRVPVTRVRFVRPAPGELSLAEAYVDLFGRILEASFGDGLRMALVPDEEEAVGSFLRGAGRRDPFDKNEAMKAGRTTAPPAAMEVAVGVDELASKLREVRKAVEGLLAAGEGGHREKYDEYLKLWWSMRETASKKKRELLGELDDLRAALEKLWPGAKGVLAEGLALTETARRHYETENCAALAQDLERLRRLKERLEVRGRPEEDDIGKWLAAWEPLLARCMNRRELAAKKLDVTAITLSYRERDEAVEIPPAFGPAPRVRFVEETALAGINGRVYRPGDLVDGEGVKVEKIRRHSVEVSWKGEVRDVPLRTR